MGVLLFLMGGGPWEPRLNFFWLFLLPDPNKDPTRSVILNTSALLVIVNYYGSGCMITLLHKIVTKQHKYLLIFPKT